jgi:hypothetical protein
MVLQYPSPDCLSDVDCLDRRIQLEDATNGSYVRF